MRRMRTGLLLTVMALQTLAATPLAAQVGPSLTGETGLFQILNAETLPAGRFSLGIYYSQSDRVASASLVTPSNVDDPLRYGVGRGAVTVGYGLLKNWEASVSVGLLYEKANFRLWSGVINGFDHTGGFSASQIDKIRLGTKWLLNPNVDAVKVVLFGGAAFPTQSGTDPNALTTNTIDWNVGASFNYKIVTFQLSYFLAGDRGFASPSPAIVYPNGAFDNPNEVVAALGFNVPIIPHVFKAIAEVNRIHYDGGDTRPPDFTEATLGGRLSLGDSGFTAAGAVRVNIDRWVKYGNKPNNIGGILQVAYSPGAYESPAPMPASAPTSSEPITQAPEPAPVPPPVPAPAPTAGTTAEPQVAAAPAPRPTTSTTDEILFDAAKSRLTNIAKAILDGVALRLKNNLSATCVIAASTDAKEKGGDHTALGRARAEAAKDYLVKRHGIDAARIMTDVKGDGDAGDATRNRRAVVTVTFP